MVAGVRPELEAFVRARPVADDVRQAVRDLAPAAAVYVGIRVLGLIALVIFARSRAVDGLARLDTYDAPRLLGIAADGYGALGSFDDIGRPLHSNVAFFPLYPLTVRLVALMGGIGITAAGFVVTALAGLAAAAGLDRLGRRLVVDSRRDRPAPAPTRARIGGLVLVALWACWPHSAVLAMPYTEALFVALAGWSLVALLAGRWITAGVLCLLAGATRPVGTALAAALMVAAAVPTIRAVRYRRRPPPEPVVAAALAPLGFLGYWGWLWLRTGRPDAWFWVQAHEWGSTFDGGRFTLAVIGTAAARPQALVLVVGTIVVLVSVLLLVALVVQGAPLPVLVYTALATYIALGAAGYENSKSRFLLCAFPLVVPIARVLTRVRVQLIVVPLVALILLAAWYNAYVLVVWSYSP